jgi:hypothetical protein
MKKIFTLSLGIITSIFSFAAFAPSRLTIAAEGNASIKVTVDGNRFEQQSYNNNVVFENLQPGFHAVKVYQQIERRGFFGRRQGTEFRLVFSASVNIKPLFSTRIELNRFGNAQVIDQPLRGGNWGRDDRRYGRGGQVYDRNNNDRDNNDRDYDWNNNHNTYNRTINDEDFFAAERVMQRENFDDARLLYAKSLVDDNYLRAEQVKELARFFSFDINRMEFAKYAYYHTIDKNNFSVVCNAFSSANSRDQLMIFIRNAR